MIGKAWEQGWHGPQSGYESIHPCFQQLQQLETRGHYYTIKQISALKRRFYPNLCFYVQSQNNFILCYKKRVFYFGQTTMLYPLILLADVYSLSWLSWLTQRTLHVRKMCVYTPSSVCPIVSLSYRRYRRQSDDRLERTLPNGPSYCGHSNRTGTFGDSPSTPGCHGNRENEKIPIIRLL